MANFAGGKRKNGHKHSCVCHICENMKNKARRGGYAEEIEKQKEKMMGGPKKKNGHRRDCQCPICKNMRNSKKYAISRSSRKTKKMRGGGDGDETNNNSTVDGLFTAVTDEEQVKKPGEGNETNNNVTAVTEANNNSTDSTVNQMPSTDNQMPGTDEELTEEEPVMGGKRRRQMATKWFVNVLYVKI